MTRDEILSMQPGPELDVVLGRALGATVERYDASYGGDLYRLTLPGWHGSIDWTTERGAWSGMPPLSSTWEGMRLVVEAMAAKGWELELRYDGKRAIADFHSHGRCRRVKYATAPHAVAIAALLALEGEHAE